MSNRILLNWFPVRKRGTKVKWTKYMDNHLSRYSDKVCSEMFNVSKTAVRMHRNKLNIKPFIEPSRKIKWEKVNKYLGMFSDGICAEMFKVSKTAVREHRNKLNIKPFVKKCRKIKWTKTMDKNIDKMSARKFSKRFNVCRTAILKRRYKIRGWCIKY